MIKTIKIIKKNEEHLTDHLDDYKKVDIVFREIRKDTVGKSSSNPTWGMVFNVRDGKLKLNVDGEGLYKEYDYDSPNAAYAEKVYSIVGRNVLENIRVPKTDVVMEKKNEPALISYKLMDNEKEDMFHISDLMFYKYDRDEITQKKNIFNIEDILECVKEQVSDEKNYNEIEKSVIHTLLLDSILNNGDRHTNNWALVRNKQTNKYELAIFDHSSALIDMIKEQPLYTCKGWVSSYTKVKETNTKLRIGNLGNEIIEYIAENYKEYFDEFSDIFNKKLPSIISQIKEENLPIDMRRLESRLNERNKFLSNIKSKGDFEYGE